MSIYKRLLIIFGFQNQATRPLLIQIPINKQHNRFTSHPSMKKSITPPKKKKKKSKHLEIENDNVSTLLIKNRFNIHGEELPLPFSRNPRENVSVNLLA